MKETSVTALYLEILVQQNSWVKKLWLSTAFLGKKACFLQNSVLSKAEVIWQKSDYTLH